MIEKVNFCLIFYVYYFWLQHEIELEERLQVQQPGNYADLNEATRSHEAPRDETADPSPPSVYAPLITATRSWEVQRKNVNINKVIGKGAFGQVAKATVVDLPGRPGQTVAAVKMLKGYYCLTLKELL